MEERGSETRLIDKWKQKHIQRDIQIGEQMEEEKHTNAERLIEERERARENEIKRSRSRDTTEERLEEAEKESGYKQTEA